MTTFAAANFSSSSSFTARPAAAAGRGFTRPAAHRETANSARLRAAKFVVRSQLAPKPAALVAAEYAVALVCCGVAAYLSFGL